MFGRLGYFLYLYYIKGVRVHHLLNNQPPEWEKIQTQKVMNNQNIHIASSLYQYLLSLVNQTNVEIENSSEQSIEVLKFRLEWLEQQLSNIRETYGKTK